MDVPMGQQQLDEINHLLHELSIAIPEIDRALRAGVDVTRQKAAAEHYQRRLMTLKSQYFPGQP